MISRTHIALIVLLFTLHLIAPIWLWRRRNHHPIRARVPVAVALGEFFLFCFAGWFATCILTEFHLSCYLYHLATLAGSMLLFGVLFVRIAVLWFRFQITLEARSLENSDHEEDKPLLNESGTSIPLVSINVEKEDADMSPGRKNKRTYLSMLARMPKIGKSGWYTDHRHYVSSKNLWIVGALLTFVNPLPFLGFYALYLSKAWNVDLSTLASDEKCPFFSNVFLQVLLTFNMVNTFSAAVKLRGVVEGLHIRKEFLAIAVLGAAQLILAIPFYHNHYVEQYFWLTSGSCFAFFTCYIPIAVSYYYEWAMNQSFHKNETSRGSTSEIPSTTLSESETPTSPKKKLEKISLHSLLVTKEGFQEFEQYLIQEMALENLYFWRDVELLKNLIHRAQKLGQNLMKKFPAEEQKIEKVLQNSEKQPLRLSPSQNNIERQILDSPFSEKTEREMESQFISTSALTLTPQDAPSEPPTSPSVVSDQFWKGDQSAREALPLCADSLPEVIGDFSGDRNIGTENATLRSQISHSVKVIFEKYISQGAPFLINISYGMSQKMRQAFAKLPEDADLEILEKFYDEPQKEIYRLMSEDSFLRFLRSRGE